MHRLRLKFPDPGQQSIPIDLTLLLVGLLTLSGVLYQFDQLTEEVNYWNTRVERLEKLQQQKTAPRTRSNSKNREISQEIRKEIVKANTVLHEINLPWGDLFDAVEHAASDDIALLSLQPNITERILRITGEAKDMSTLLDFIEALEREIILDKTHLLSHKIKLDNPHRPVTFLLTTSWIEAS